MIQLFFYLDLNDLSKTEKLIGLITAVIALLGTLLKIVYEFYKFIKRRRKKNRLKKLTKIRKNVIKEPKRISLNSSSGVIIDANIRSEKILQEIGFYFEVITTGNNTDLTPPLRFIKCKISVNNLGYFEVYHDNGGALSTVLPRITNSEIIVLLESTFNGDFSKIIRFGKISKEPEIIYELRINSLVLPPALSINFGLDTVSEFEVNSLSVDLTKDKPTRGGDNQTIYLKD